MDGVEYVNAVLKTIRNTFGPDRFEVRIDEDVFIPGLTLRQNLERELIDAEIILAILDGLRPNVVYELGFAFGLREASDIGTDENERQIICLAERNATVLVRNYYPDPMAVPTTTGETVKILNPPLNICSSFSDNADLLLLTYDRLDLEASLACKLSKLISDIQREDSKQDLASEAAGTEPRPTITDESVRLPTSDGSTADSGIPLSGGQTSQTPTQAESASLAIETSALWDAYEARQYDLILEKTQPPKSSEQRKVLALSLMKLGRIYDAMQTWKELLSTGTSEAAANFHLGVCYYIIRDYDKAALYFNEAEAVEGSSPRILKWQERLNAKRRYSQARAAGSGSESV